MAVNRFRNIGFNPKNIEYYADTQEEFLPDISGLAKTVSSLDDQLNQDLELPNYLRQSESDVAESNQFRTDSEAYRQGAIEDFKAGNIAGGNQKLKGYRDFLHKSKQPGGTFAELERGVSEYANALKEITATYKDPKSKQYSPELFRLAKSKLDSGINPFKDDVGNLRTSISAPTLMDDTPRREAVKHYNSILNNLKSDQIVFADKQRQVKGMSYKQILESGKKEFIDPSKVASILLNATTDEHKRAFEQFGQATGREGQGSVIRKDILKEDGTIDSSKISNMIDIFDTNSALGSLLKGLTESKSFTKFDSSNKILTDSAGLAHLNSSLRKAEKKAEFELGSVYSRSNLFTKGSGMEDLDIKDGKVQIGTTLPPNLLSDPETSKAFSNMSAKDKKEFMSKNARPDYRDMSYEEYIQTPKGGTNRALVNIVERFPQDPRWSNKKYNEMIEGQYKKMQEKMRLDDVDYLEYRGSKQGEIVREDLIGKRKTGIGSILHKNIIIQKPGEEPVTVKFDKLLEEMDITLEQFKDGFNVLGEIKSDNSLTASGTQAIYYDKENGATEFIVSDISNADAQIKTPIWNLSQTAYKGGVDVSPWTSTGIPEIDAEGDVRTIAVDNWTSDILKKRLLNEQSPTQIKALEEQIQKLEDNPELEEFQGRDVLLRRFDYESNNPDEYGHGVPIMVKKNGVVREMTFQELVNLTEKSAINERR